MYQESFFEITAAKYPSLNAVDDHGKVLTYSELNNKSIELSILLKSLGCFSNERICIFTSKSINQYIGILGTLKSGGCWVPISNEFPNKRLLSLLESLKPIVILCDESTYELSKELIDKISFATNLIFLDEDGNFHKEKSKNLRFLKFKNDNLFRNRSPEDLAYIIFTSGTTGNPKGVMVKHRNTSQFLGLCGKFFNIKSRKRFAHFSDITFDPSVFDLFFCWASGGTLVPFNKRIYKINPGIFFRENNINILFTIPDILSNLKKSKFLYNSCLEQISHLLLTGEVIPPQLVKEWFNLYPKTNIYNMYGTTETAIVSHWYKIPSNFNDQHDLPVGYPLPGTQVFLMNKNKIVSVGESGESVVSGSQISPGYWNDETQTKKVFKKNTLNKNIPNIFYHTGDLLKVDASGLYYFVGRNDSQVKISGKRIELGAIEKLILSYLEVVEASVLALKLKGNQCKKIIAFVNLSDSKLKNEFESYLKENLQKYMYPSKIIYPKKKLPRLSNGKVNKKELNYIASTQILGSFSLDK